MRQTARLGALLLAVTAIGSGLAGAAVAAGTTSGLDLAFGSCGVAESVPMDEVGRGLSWGADSVALQPGGKILLGGNAQGFRAVTRLLPDGSIDHSFGRNGTIRNNGVDGPVLVAAQPDGRILATGHLQTMSRLLADGSPDASFGQNGHAALPGGMKPFALALQVDGKVLASGQSSILRLTASGAPDATFGAGGTVASLPGRATGIAVQPDGGIVVSLVVDGVRNADFGVIRLLADGSPDQAFAGGAVASVDRGHDYSRSVSVDSEGRVLVAGDMNADGRGGIGLARFLPGGTLDPAFGDGGVAVARPSSLLEVAGMVVQPDGRAAVGISARDAAGQDTFGLARFTDQGQLDEGFSEVTFGGRRADATGVVRAPDGTVVVVGTVGDGYWNTAAAVRFLGDAPPSQGAVDAQSCTASATLTTVGQSGDLGQTDVGRVSDARTFTLRSTGTAAVRVRKVAFSEDHHGQFLIASDTCTGASVPPGASCQVSVAFAPSTTGHHTTSIVVWDDAGYGWQNALLVGAGVAPVTGWGWNGVGALGPTSDEFREVSGPIGVPGAMAVASGYFHGLALKGDGSVWAWGWNHFGQLGNGTTVDAHSAVQVPGLTDVVGISAGAYHSLAVTRDGTVWGWGFNSVGQLGDGSTADRLVPTRVGGLPAAAKVVGGGVHSLALMKDGTVWGWGWNGFGQLGDGTLVERHRPVRVVGLTDATTLAGGAYHSLAVRGDGTVRAWGFNGFGQLGDGTKVDRRTPVTVIGLSKVIAVAAGAYHSLALLDGGTVRSWGHNSAGQLGDGTVVDRVIPVPVKGLAGVQEISGGFVHSVAVESDGSADAWGWNATGQLGDNTTTNRVLPVRVVGVANASSAGGGILHSFAL